MDEKIGRRNFFGSLVKWILGLTVASWIVPVGMYLFPKSKVKVENILMDPSGNPITASSIAKDGSEIGLAFGNPTVVINYK